MQLVVLRSSLASAPSTPIQVRRPCGCRSGVGAGMRGDWQRSGKGSRTEMICAFPGLQNLNLAFKPKGYKEADTSILTTACCPVVGGQFQGQDVGRTILILGRVQYQIISIAF